MPRRSAVLIVLASAIAGGLCQPIPAGATTVLGLRHVGPLRLGMTVSAALSTGWLAHRGRGCPLGSPVPITYRLDGRRAPHDLRGLAQFDGGRLTNLSFSAGVRTTAGVRVGVTSPDRMASRYRKAGYKARAEYVDTFGGTFVTVDRGGSTVIGAFATGPTITTLAIPIVAVCE
jgi:hypothetical protein